MIEEMTPVVQWHVLLLRAAGRISDETLAELRFALAEGRIDACAQVLAGAFPMTAAELAVVAAALPPGTALPAPAEDGIDEPPAVVFVPVPPDSLALYGNLVPPLLDVSGDDDRTDAYDEVVLEALDPRETAGVWRGWRLGEADPARIYVVESDEAAGDLPGVAAAVQRALADVGDLTSQVEVYRADLPLPSYQWAARSGSALIHAPYPAPEIRFAAEDALATPLDDDEREAALAYLRDATAMMPGLHTDGRWVWPATLADRLEATGELADPDLLDHLRQTEYVLWLADAVAVHRALAALQQLGAGEVVDDEPATDDLATEDPATADPATDYAATAEPVTAAARGDR